MARSRSQSPGKGSPPARPAGGRARRRSAGFTLMELMIVVAVIAIVAAVAIPSLAQARKSANEASAVSSLRSISTVQYHYRLRFLSYGTIENLVTAGSLDDSWADKIHSGYQFESVVPAGGSTWSATADPLSPGVTGDRSFFIDESGVIRFNEEFTADSTDPPID